MILAVLLGGAHGGRVPQATKRDEESDIDGGDGEGGASDGGDGEGGACDGGNGEGGASDSGRQDNYMA